MKAVAKLNTRPQDAESTQGKDGHHNVTRSCIKKHRNRAQCPSVCQKLTEEQKEKQREKQQEK